MHKYLHKECALNFVTELAGLQMHGQGARSTNIQCSASSSTDVAKLCGCTAKVGLGEDPHAYRKQYPVCVFKCCYLAWQAATTLCK